MADLKIKDIQEVDKSEKPNTPRRKKRESHGLARLRLTIPREIVGYYVRWVNDDGIEVEYRLQNDYEFVEPKEVGLQDEENSKVKRLVGTKENGDPLFAYLMKIRQEWRDEDVAEESQMQRQFEEQVKSGAVAGGGKERYDAGISISSGNGRRSK